MSHQVLQTNYNNTNRNITDIYQDIGVCVKPYYKPRLKLFRSLIGDTVTDALLYMPTSTIEVFKINELSHEYINQQVIVTVIIDNIELPKYSSNKPILMLGHICEKAIELLFFNYKPSYLKGTFYIGCKIQLIGQLTKSNLGNYQMINPKKANFKTNAGIYNIYPLKNGVTQDCIYSITENALEILNSYDIKEWLPEYIINKYNFYSFYKSLVEIHKPNTSNISLINNTYRRRICFDEILAEQIAIQINKTQESKCNGINGSIALLKDFIKTLPFELTNSQVNAINELINDMKKNIPMKRLLQGDVGSGKTIVAILAMLYVINNGYQCALLVPTEMLARQHYNNIINYLNNISIEILTANEKGKVRTRILRGLKDNTVKIVVGTHALFNNKLEFNNLGLVIVDEQHRFGVNQRLSLINKGNNPHILSMTATPIPRTIIMSMHGDIDVSSIESKPIGRRDIITTSLSLDKINELISAIRRILEKGEKVYWVCPLIEDSEKLDYTCVIERHAFLKQYFGNDVEMLHGKMNASEKQQIFNKFNSNNVNVLVSTTVIEVGIDVPNATVIIIENAERFGLAQLHQLRGRVGRSSLQSYCILLHDKHCSNIARQRIKIMCHTNSGFKIAEYDLKFRGGGEINGIKQSGMKKYKTFDYNNIEDQNIINEYIIEANKLAKSIVQLNNVALYSDCLRIFKPNFSLNINKSF
ncbi:MAG: ATP-dependent DNA helicase RecG [Alphaproteobacteria bacterium]|nr:ATP-dependent DNA helicase RecG [Alphaproteobacteria bacterium]